MQIIIVGAGKLAAELLHTMRSNDAWLVSAWSNNMVIDGCSVVVHAGSGRELRDVLAYCQKNHATLVELATGSLVEQAACPFPVVICPNTNILMLKFMAMLSQSGHLFSGYKIRLTESHQSSKTSVPGTAISMAESLGLAAHALDSVRDPEIQAKQLNIPSDHLNRHAYHQIMIDDGVCSVTMETRVYGDSPYVDGVVQIVRAIQTHALEDRRYDIGEFVDKGWL